MADAMKYLPFTEEMRVEFPPDVVDLVYKEKAELEEAGVKVTGVYVAGRSPPRYKIEFTPGVPSFKVRKQLANLRFDIGQTMGDKMLGFYATRRVVETTGWD